MHVLQGRAAIVAQPGQRQRSTGSAVKQLRQPHLFGQAGLIHFIHYSFLNIDIRYPDHCPGCAYPPRTNHNKRTTVATKMATGNNHPIFITFLPPLDSARPKNSRINPRRWALLCLTTTGYRACVSAVLSCGSTLEITQTSRADQPRLQFCSKGTIHSVQPLLSD